MLMRLLFSSYVNVSCKIKNIAVFPRYILINKVYVTSHRGPCFQTYVTCAAFFSGESEKMPKTLFSGVR